jgi:hypothetical protein
VTRLSKEAIDQIRAVVREEIERALEARRPKRRRRLPCGTGSRVPECWGSTIYGPSGCYCWDRDRTP